MTLKKNDSLLLSFIRCSAIIRLNIRIMIYVCDFYFYYPPPPLRPNNTFFEFIGMYNTKWSRSVITDKDTENVNILTN